MCKLGGSDKDSGCWKDKGLQGNSPSCSPAPVQVQAPLSQLPPILPPHCPREHRAATHSNAARKFTRKETFLSGHRFEIISRQGLAFGKCVIKEFVGSFLNEALVQLTAALLIMLQLFHPYANMLYGKIPSVTP